MAETRKLRIVRRIMIAACGATLFLAVYLASLPSSFYWSERYFQRAIPSLLVLYAPARVYMRSPDWPGSKTYAEYSTWGYNEISERLRGDPESAMRLDAPTIVQFSGVSLRDAVNYLGELQKYPIELDSEVNGAAEVTVSLKAPLRDALAAMLEPLGLKAWPAKNRIVIATPEAIRRIRAEAAANRPVAPGAWILLALFVLSTTPLVLLLFYRRSAKSVPDNRGLS